jgi:hypothetical protein
MKYLKKFESFSEVPVHEKITDFFKNREEIADAFLLALKDNPEKALNSILPYYDDFVDKYFAVCGNQIPRDASGKCTLDSENLLDILEFVPNFAGTADKPGIFARDEDGDTFVDKSKLGLASKITRDEVMNLISTHEDFSLNKLNFLAMYKKVGALRRLGDSKVGTGKRWGEELVPGQSNRTNAIDGVLANVETEEEEKNRKGSEALRKL